MACLLKAPTEKSRGVVTFTTQERNYIIFKDPEVRRQIEALKNRWVVGLHHNWHDDHFKYDPLFDFSMAGEDDLKEVSGKTIPLIPMDACNFTPEFFRPTSSEGKFWDILYVARAVNFKRIPEFFQGIRKLYDMGHMYRVLHVCPIPEYDRASVKTDLYNVREIYDGLFSEKEKDFFTLLTTTYRNPFPFDLMTLAHFYRSSRVFVHYADNERRCRVAAYAWSAGMPVVARSCVGSLIPAELRKEPYYFEARDDEDFPSKIIQAVESTRRGTPDFEPVRNIVSNDYTKQELIQKLGQHFSKRGLPFEPSQAALSNLDIRLGRHHGLGGDSPNIIPGFGELLGYLGSRGNSEIAEDLSNVDPERHIVRLREYATDRPVDHLAQQRPLAPLIINQAKRGVRLAARLLGRQ